MGVAVAGSRGSGRSVEAKRPHLYLVPPAAPAAEPAPAMPTIAAVPRPRLAPDGVATAIGATGTRAADTGATATRAPNTGATATLPADIGGANPGMPCRVAGNPSVRRPVRSTPPPARRPSPVRLTRRGRVVVVLFLLGLMVGIAVLLSTASQASAPAGPDRAVTVHSGDTLWSISVAAMPGVRPDAAMAQIRRLNHMSDNTIYVGQQLILPPTR